MGNAFTVTGKLSITMPKACINDTVKDIINGFFYRSVEISYVPSDGLFIQIGEKESVPLKDGEGVISVSDKGVYITAINQRALLTSLFILLRRVQAENLEEGKEELFIPFCEEVIQPKIARRMLHLCVFARTPVHSFKKMIRLACVLGYTHIILEFWGTFPFDCLKELAWKNASYTKAEISEILQEAKDLQVELIPMINSFGHATGSSAFKGKHVVLDQKPRLASLFSHDGWRWRFDKAEVRELFRKMRQELYEIFGEGEYFHIGFDEGFSYPWDESSVNALSQYIKELCEEIIQEGRKPMLWGDQFLHEPTLGINLGMGYEGNAPTQEIAEQLLSSVPKEAVVCDWQYFVKEGTWISTKYFTEKGYNVMACPWTDVKGFNTSVATAEAFKCYGLLHTTWNKPFSEGAVYSLFYAHDTFFNRGLATKKVGNTLEDATLLRKICFADGDYDKAGWYQLDSPSVFSL